MSRLGLGLGLIKGGGIRGLPFNPLSYDPSIYFNADDSMLSAMQNPTLDLDPSVPSSLDIITATRAGTATVTDASGNIVDAAPNTVRVDHVQGELITAARTNLMGYSEPTFAQYSSIFGSGISEVVIADSGLTQWTQFDDTAGVNRYVTKSGFPFVVGQTYVFSFYVRMNDGGAPVVGNSNSGVSSDLMILIEGNSYAGTAGGIESLGSGLYRVWGKRTASGTSTSVHIYKYNNQSARGFRVSGLQVEQAEAPTALIDNDTGAPITVPAVYGPRVPMILVEPSATNLLLYSEDFSDSYWTKYSIVTFTDNYATAPNGTQEASRFVSVGGAYPQFSKGIVGLTIGQLYTVSFYIKSDGTSQIQQVSHITGVSGANTDFTPTDEWVRKSYSFTATATSHQLVVFTNGGSAPASSYLIWGFQFETGSVATSYIPTSGSTVTRAADDLVISGSDFTDFYNQSEGTIYCEASTYRSGYNALISISDGTLNERAVDWSMGSGINGTISRVFRVDVFDGGVGQANLGSNTTLVAGQLEKGAFSFKVNDFAFCHAGGTSVTDSSGTLASPTELRLGNRLNSSQLNGHIKRMIYWPVHSSRLSSDFLTQVTGISTSGDVLAEIELKADNLDLVPVLRNLGQGASNATQDTALNQPIAHVPVNGGHLYLSGVAGSYAQIATPLTIGTNDNFRIEVGINTNGGNFNLITGVSSASRISFYNGVFFFGSQQVTCSQPASGQSVLVVERISAVISIYQNAVLLGAAGATTSTMDMYRIGAAMGFATSIPTLEGTISYFKASVAGTPVLDIDFSKAPHAATTFTPTVGGTVTINQAGNDPATIVRRPFLRFDGVNSKMSGLFDSTITGGTFFMVARGRTQSTNGYYFYTTKSGEDGVHWRYTPTSGTLRSYYQESVELEHSAANSGIGHLVSHVKLTDVGEASLNGQFLTDATNPEVNSEAYTIGISQSVAADIEHMSFFPESSRINTRTNTRAMLTYLEGKYPATTIVEPPLNPTFELIPTGESIVAIKTRSLVQGTDGKLYGAPYNDNFDKLLRIDPVTGSVDYDTLTPSPPESEGQKWVAGFKLNDGRTFHNAHGATAGNLIVDVSTGSPVLSTMGQTFYQGNPVGGQHRGGLQSSSDQLIYQSNYTAAKGFPKLNPATGQYLTHAVYTVIDTGPLYSSNLPLAESSQHYRQWGLCEDPVSKFIFGTPVGGDRIVFHDVINNVTEQGADLLTGNVPAPTSTSSDYFMKYTGDGIYSPISQRIYCFPRRANAILVINPADKSAIEIPTPDELNDPVLQKSFAAVMGGDGCIYSVPWGVPYLFRIDPRNHEIRTWNIQDIFTAAGGQLGVGWWTAGMAVGNEIWYAPGGAHDVLKVSLNYGFDSGFGAGFK